MMDADFHFTARSPALIFSFTQSVVQYAGLKMAVSE
jgi:hypothetical protein